MVSESHIANYFLFCGTLLNCLLTYLFSIMDTIGTAPSVLIKEVSSLQG